MVVVSSWLSGIGCRVLVVVCLCRLSPSFPFSFSSTECKPIGLLLKNLLFILFQVSRHFVCLCMQACLPLYSTLCVRAGKTALFTFCSVCISTLRFFFLTSFQIPFLLQMFPDLSFTTPPSPPPNPPKSNQTILVVWCGGGEGWKKRITELDPGGPTPLV